MRVNLIKIIRSRQFILIVILVLVLVSSLFYVNWLSGSKKAAETAKEEIPLQNGNIPKSAIPESSSEEKPKEPATEETSPKEKTQEEKIKEADQWLAQGEYDKAIPLYEEVIQKDPHYVPAYNSLAMTYAKKGDKEKALQIIDQGLKENPGDFSLEQTKDIILYVLPNL